MHNTKIRIDEIRCLHPNDPKGDLISVVVAADTPATILWQGSHQFIQARITLPFGHQVALPMFPYIVGQKLSFQHHIDINLHKVTLGTQSTVPFKQVTINSGVSITPHGQSTQLNFNPVDPATPGQFQLVYVVLPFAEPLVQPIEIPAPTQDQLNRVASVIIEALSEFSTILPYGDNGGISVDKLQYDPGNRLINFTINIHYDQSSPLPGVPAYDFHSYYTGTIDLNNGIQGVIDSIQHTNYTLDLPSWVPGGHQLSFTAGDLAALGGAIVLLL